MSFYSGFFNAKNNDRVYSAEDFTSYLSGFICNGIMDTYGDNFKYSTDGLKLKIGTGKAWINGHYFVSDSLYSDGRLNITGNGTTYSYEKASEGLFYKNLTIKKVNISSGITSIGSHLFYECSNLESAELPVTVTNIGERAFDSTKIKSVAIPSNVKTIGSYSFAHCSYLSTATVNSIVMGSYMFVSCGSLKKLTISKNTTTFGSNMLTYCGVTEITYLGTIDEWKAITKPNNWICSADGYHNGTLQKITMTNGYMEYKNNVWYTYKN